MIDKARLVRGQATGINAVLLGDAIELWRERKAERQAELQAQVRERLAGGGAV